jgi:hypothetical protein
MALYLYQTTLFTNTSHIYGLNVSQNNADLSDYTSTHQSSTEKISDVVIAETTFTTQLTYAQFKSAIASPLTWVDVKEIDSGDHYDLYLLTNNPI